MPTGETRGWTSLSKEEVGCRHADRLHQPLRHQDQAETSIRDLVAIFEK